MAFKRSGFESPHLHFFFHREPFLKPCRCRVTIHDTVIDDTFGKRFHDCRPAWSSRPKPPRGHKSPARVTTGYAASVIGCDAEAGIERTLNPGATPDGRPGVSLLLFAFNLKALQQAVINRVGQCILTCPTTACYNDLPIVKERASRVGGNLRFFGDGYQFSKKLDGRRFCACR